MMFEVISEIERERLIQTKKLQNKVISQAISCCYYTNSGISDWLKKFSIFVLKINLKLEIKIKQRIVKKIRLLSFDDVCSPKCQKM